MSKNSFVACGGTGAHAMLAMLRLHMLGSPFGFFINGKFPDLFLVDQDYDSDAKDEGECTAWGKVKKLIDEHPGRYKPGFFFGFQGLPSPKRPVTPLPVGSNKDWSVRPNNKLAKRFPRSKVLNLITNQRQREIEYDRGMMASPAVGSLLFSLKELDTDDSKSNNDEQYIELLRDCRGNVVICGSSVGGTGASVAPTLASYLHKQDAEVMVVLVHRWFEFIESSEKAKKRNEDMKQNAAGGLAYSGGKLANEVAAVLVGVSDSELVKREYTVDNKQAYKDSYVHVIGALAGMRHLLSNDGSVASGLYGMSASDPSKLTGDIKIGDGKHSTLNDLVGQAECLVHVLKLYHDILNKYERHQNGFMGKVSNFISTGSPHSLQQEICRLIYDAVDKNVDKVKRVGRELEKVKEVYNDLLKWLKGLDMKSDISGKDRRFFEKEYHYLDRIREDKLSLIDGLEELEQKTDIRVGREEYIALSLFHWIARWIKDWWENEKGETDVSIAERGYWPPAAVEDQTDAFEWGIPGTLGKLKKN